MCRRSARPSSRSARPRRRRASCGSSRCARLPKAASSTWPRCKRRWRRRARRAGSGSRTRAATACRRWRSRAMRAARRWRFRWPAPPTACARSAKPCWLRCRRCRRWSFVRAAAASLAPHSAGPFFHPPPGGSPMNFTPDAEQTLLRENIRRFMKSQVAPLVASHDAAKSFPFDLLEGLAQFGYIGGRLPQAEGGMDLASLTWAMLMEETGYAWLSLRTMLNITNGSIHKIAAEGTPEQKERFLQPLLASQRRCFTAISEPGTGSNIAQVQTRADLQGDHYVLNGRKLWISNGAFADFGIVVARTFSPDCQGQLSTFLVERAVSPYEMRRVDTMVLRSTGTAELGFDQVK